MRNNPRVAVLQPYEAVLVDEYQDLNKADQNLIEELSRGGGLTVIGDDNQSIYSFRHANPEGIRVFPREHPGTVPFVIQECRRCPPNIVSLSNALIGHDPLARPLPLAPSPRRAPASVTIVQHLSIDDESQNVAAFIDHYLRTHPDVPAGQVLVLSPRRLMGTAVKDALIQRGRNALSYFWEDHVDEDAAAEGFCLLTLLVSITDRAAYRAWLGIGHPAGNSPAYSRLRAAAQEAGIEPFEAGDRLVAGALRLPYSAGIRARHEALRARLAALARLEGLDLVNALWPEGTDATRTIRTAAQAIAVDTPAAADLLEELRTAITQPELPGSDGDVIRVMSLHKSKGLTAALVVVVGCVSGAIPTVHNRLPPAEQDAELREQRRLFYVAITRATSTLVLSSVTQLPRQTALQAGIDPGTVYRRGPVAMARIAASPFLAELGPDAPAAITGGAWRTAVGF